MSMLKRMTNYPQVRRIDTYKIQITPKSGRLKLFGVGQAVLLISRNPKAIFVLHLNAIIS